MSFDFSIPNPVGQTTNISVAAGSSAIFVGANGSGKTRLAVHMENAMAMSAHRISAHRALELNPTVAKIDEQTALLGLRMGWADQRASIGHRSGYRWKSKDAVFLLNDFDFLVQSLFADQSRKTLVTHQRARKGNFSEIDSTKFEHLVEIWERLLPDRKIKILGDTIEVEDPRTREQYNASEMSDGERAIFYMIGQALVASANSVLIIDEPELHVHRSILGKLWDELEAARQDCAFIFITHDLGFASDRVGQKFVISSFAPTPSWTVDIVPANAGFGEQLTTLILGSRKPILFVEGNESSLDASIYRCCFPQWTVIPKGSCEAVIRSVVAMRHNKDLTRVTCSGIVDADDYDASDIAILGQLGIAVLPVSEIENLILLPTVSRAIAENEGYEEAELDARLQSLKAAIFNTLNPPGAIDAVVARYCRRRIDRLLKKIDLSSGKTVADVAAEYARQVSAVDIAAIARLATSRIQTAIQDDDLPTLLANYDNKSLVSLAALHLKGSKAIDFESWLIRILRNKKLPALVAAINGILPTIQAH